MENKRIAIVSCRQAVHPLLLGEKSKSTREQSRREEILLRPVTSLHLLSSFLPSAKPIESHCGRRRKKKIPSTITIKSQSIKAALFTRRHGDMVRPSHDYRSLHSSSAGRTRQENSITFSFLSLFLSLCIFLTGADEMGRILFRRPFYSAADGAGCDDEEQHPAAEQQEFDCETDKDVGRSASRLHSAADVAAAADRSRRIGSHNVAVQRFEKIADV